MAETFETIVCDNCKFPNKLSAATPKRERLCRNCIQPLVRHRRTQGMVKASDIPFVKRLTRELSPTPIKNRLAEAAAAKARNPDDVLTILYQHTAFCQTSLPYRDPGDEVREWERLNGSVHLKILAGEAFHQELGQFVQVGLPFGPKARMV